MAAPKDNPTPPAADQTTVADVAAWLEELIAEGARRIELRGPLGGDPVVVRRIPENDPPTGDTITTMAQRILRAATSDASTHPTATSVRYTLHAIDGAGQPLATMRITAIASGARGKASDALDYQGAAQLVGTMGRHIQDTHRTILQRIEQQDAHSAETIATLQTIIRELRDENGKLHAQIADMGKDRLALYKTLQELASEEAARQRAEQSAAKSEERKDRLFSKFEKYVPMGLNRLLGGGPGKGGPLGGDVLMDLLASLRPEQIDGLIKGAQLDIDQTTQFTEIFQMYGEAYKRRQEGEQRRLAASTETPGEGGEPKPEDAPPRAPAT